MKSHRGRGAHTAMPAAPASLTSRHPNPSPMSPSPACGQLCRPAALSLRHPLNAAVDPASPAPPVHPQLPSLAHHTSHSACEMSGAAGHALTVMASVVARGDLSRGDGGRHCHAARVDVSEGTEGHCGGCGAVGAWLGRGPEQRLGTAGVGLMGGLRVLGMEGMRGTRGDSDRCPWASDEGAWHLLALWVLCAL